MRSLAALLAAFLVGATLAPSGAHGQAAPSVEIAANDPGFSDELANYEPLYVKLAYRSDQPILLGIEGLSGGQRVPGMSGGLRRGEPGSGDVVLWIAFNQGVSIDGLRVRVYDTWQRPISSYDVPARMQWAAASARPMSERAEWVRRAYAREQQIAPSAPISTIEATIETVIGGGAMLAVPLYFVLQAWLGFAWTGGWRMGALAPLVLIGPAVLWSLYALSHQSNLWPITVILLSPLCLVYLVVLCAARAMAGRFAT